MTDDGHSPINMGVYESVWMPGIKFFSKKYSENASGRRKSEINILVKFTPLKPQLNENVAVAISV